MRSEVVFAPICETTKNLPIYLCQGSINFLQHGIEREHGYEEHHWIHTVAGTGILKISGQTYCVEETQGFFIPKNMPHAYYPKSRPWIQDWITFEGLQVESILSSAGLKMDGIYTIHSSETLHIEITRIIQSIKQTPDLKPFFLFAMLTNFLSVLCHSVLDNAQATKTPLSSVMKYMQQNYSQDLPMYELAEMIQVSEQHLCKLFRKYTSMRPSEYLTKIRLNSAKCLLLEDPSLSIREIANQSGFNSCNYFCTVFKQHEGKTPSEFRRLY